MSPRPLLKPYESTSFTFDEGSSRLSIESPWVSANFDVLEETAGDVKRAVSLLSNRDKNVDTEVLQNFLRNFDDLPILQAVPRSISAENTHYHSSAELLMSSTGPREFLQRINSFSDIDVERDLPYLPKTWSWNTDETAEASRIKGTDLYDPISAYTSIRHARLSYQMSCSEDAHRLIKWLNEKKQSDSDLFLSAMADVLSQQYYVTGQCAACLAPAAATHILISEEVNEYHEEELHHDKLILQSIRHLSDKDESAFVFMPEVKLEIEAIKYAAHHCALGFSALVSIMEGTVYPEQDPVGALLSDSPRPEAQKGVEAHFQINKRGNHTAIPERFVNKIPPVTRQTIDVACRLAEVTILLDTGLAKSLFRFFNESDQ